MERIEEIVMKRKYVQAMMTGMTAMLAVTVPVTTVAAATPEKEQTVYVNADQNGNVEKVIVAAFSAIHTCKKLQKHKGIRTGSFILTTLIVLSTMFLKQHSIADVATGITCAVATYVLFYSRAAEKQGAKAKQRSPLHQHDTHM